MADETRILTASCHCKSSTLSFTIPSSSLPLPTHFCHCSVCRKTHGTLCTIHTPIPPPTVDLSTFTSYASSEAVMRLFCATCGTHMLDRETERDGKGERWCVATSLVDAEEGTWRFGAHNFLESTGDGGFSNWLQEIGGEKVEMWREKSGDAGGDWVSPLAHTAKDKRSEELDKKNDGKLRARCHCGGIDFFISRPDPNSFTHMPESLTPKDKSKWHASLDACTSCRLCSSNFITAWAFPLVSAITLPDGSPYTPTFGTAKYYSSSEGVSRTFCGTCGALVSYACDDRPEMIDIGVGLLESGAGALAGDWLEWRTQKVSWEEDAVWKKAVGSLKDGLKKWGEGS
ncbi:Mss4-like protein [Lophiotrema nucula]|uniref:Mss4-like protein n=1 Tax=Lophiotrema nucula TaxID=690887 RepID=A0A6A5ZEJ1_9PLEO|nr:Mss4-like protein [Lophiotrema nucula]